MTEPRNVPIHIVGGGLAGSEAAWQIAQAGCPVVVHEMRPNRMTEAHHTDGFAELVCSNSFRSDDKDENAVGLLHEEMRQCGSLILRSGDANKVPAGGALAVDRDGFSRSRHQGELASTIRMIEISEKRRSPACRRPNGATSSSQPAPSPRRPLADAIQAN